MSYYGFNEDFLIDFIQNDTPQGIDRIVPIGKTMDFSMIWDGYDLIETLSRKIEIILKSNYVSIFENSKMNSNLISISGIDGSGKSTQLDLLKKYYEDLGFVLFIFGQEVEVHLV